MMGLFVWLVQRVVIGKGSFCSYSVQVLLIRSFQELGLAVVLMCTVMRTCLPRTRMTFFL
jgi:hypothetical protein